MTKKTPISNLNMGDARLNEICPDAETMAIIDAQCEEHKTGRAKFIAVVVRLFLDFSYIAKTVGKDIFSFRDEMIKAIVRSKGNSPDSGGDILETISSTGKKSGGNDSGLKSSAADDFDVKGLGEKFSAMAEELNELRAAFLELKSTVSLAVKGSVEQQVEKTNGSRQRAGDQNASKTKDIKISEISIDELAGEFKNSLPPSYKDKRKKLQKLKF